MKKIVFFIGIIVLLMFAAGCNGNKTSNPDTQKETNTNTQSENNATGNSEKSQLPDSSVNQLPVVENQDGVNSGTNMIEGTNPDAFKRSPVRIGPPHVWPEDMPADVPRFECDITEVMRDDNFKSYKRIFFANVTDKYLEEYVELLKDKGFYMEYVVYQTPGVIDNGQKRRQLKDCDLVRASNGRYEIGIEFGGGQATYDFKMK